MRLREGEERDVTLAALLSIVEASSVSSRPSKCITAKASTGRGGRYIREQVFNAEENASDAIQRLQHHT